MSRYASQRPTEKRVNFISNRYLVTGDVKQIPNSRDIYQPLLMFPPCDYNSPMVGWNNSG